LGTSSLKKPPSWLLRPLQSFTRSIVSSSNSYGLSQWPGLHESTKLVTSIFIRPRGAEMREPRSASFSCGETEGANSPSSFHQSRGAYGVRSTWGTCEYLHSVRL
jgi:hypothetical protein